MKIAKTPQEFVDESLLLLRARPTTTKVTTTYHAAESGKGKLTFKTYDPASGAIVKFRTSRLAIVGRMMAGLNRLGRQQANVPEPVVVDTPMTDVMSPTAATPGGTPVAGQAAGQATPLTTEPASKNKKKKKKGKS